MKVFGRNVIGGATLLWGSGVWIDANLNNGRIEGESLKAARGITSWRRGIVVVNLAFGWVWRTKLQ